MRIATFNLQNLRLRTRDGRDVLGGAWDGDMQESAQSDILAKADRLKTARVIAESDADVVALQEVFDLEALDFFHDCFLVPAGAKRYDQRVCLSGNDGRGFNVAVLSRDTVQQVRSHADKTGADFGLSGLSDDLRDFPLFRRDCLEIHLDRIALFICHFKAPYPDFEKAFAVRRAEAKAVRRIVEERYKDPKAERWIILGDFNEPAYRVYTAKSAMKALCDGFAVDLLDRLPSGQDWTFEIPDTHLHIRPDRILVSPLLAREFPDTRPQIIRSGLGISRSRENLKWSEWHSRASDHALVFADFPGL